MNSSGMRKVLLLFDEMDTFENGKGRYPFVGSMVVLYKTWEYVKEEPDVGLYYRI